MVEILFWRYCKDSLLGVAAIEYVTLQFDTTACKAGSWKVAGLCWSNNIRRY
jgi:hypothetical protein